MLGSFLNDSSAETPKWRVNIALFELKSIICRQGLVCVRCSELDWLHSCIKLQSCGPWSLLGSPHSVAIRHGRERGEGAQQKSGLGAGPRMRRGGVLSAARADAWRCGAGDFGVHHRGAPTRQTLLGRGNPKGARGLPDDGCVAHAQRYAPASPRPRASRSPRKPHARGPS
jgi:hypothetical protein